MGSLRCKESAPSKILYSLARVSLIVGQHDLTLINVKKDLIHTPSEIILHPKYIRNKRDMNDLGNT